MGCKESKLAVATTEPMKRSKSASSSSFSSRSSSMRVENPNTNVDHEKTKSIGLSPLEQKKPVESRGCQTMECCLEDGIKEKSTCESSQHDGQRGGNEVENDVVVSKKETAEEVGDEHKEIVEFVEENKKMESGVLAKENELKCETQGKANVETLKAREEDQVKIEEGEAQSTNNDQAEAIKEEAQVVKPNEVKAETMAEEDNGKAQNVNDKVEVAKEEEAEKVEPTMAEEDSGKAQNVNDKIEVVKEEKEGEKVNEPTKAEAETIVVEDGEEARNANDEVVVAKEEDEAKEVEPTGAKVANDKVADTGEEAIEIKPIEPEVETTTEDNTEEALNVDDDKVVVEEAIKEVELAEAEVEEETDVLQTEDEQISENVEKVDPIELKDGTIDEEKTEDSEA